MADTNAPDLPRYVITGGGTPTPEQLAAVTVALTPVAVAVEDDAAPTDGLAPWARAGLLESIGHRRFVAMPDLAAGRFPMR